MPKLRVESSHQVQEQETQVKVLSRQERKAQQQKMLAQVREIPREQQVVVEQEDLVKAVRNDFMIDHKVV
jgi:hypothetical protein